MSQRQTGCFDARAKSTNWEDALSVAHPNGAVSRDRLRHFADLLHAIEGVEDRVSGDCGIEALRTVEKAARTKDARANFVCAAIYLRGCVTARNMEKSEKYRAAAEKLGVTATRLEWARLNRSGEKIIAQRLAAAQDNQALGAEYIRRETAADPQHANAINTIGELIGLCPVHLRAAFKLEGTLMFVSADGLGPRTIPVLEQILRESESQRRSTAP